MAKSIKAAKSAAASATPMVFDDPYEVSESGTGPDKPVRSTASAAK